MIATIDESVGDTNLIFDEFNDYWINTLITEYLKDSEKHKMIINNLFDDEEAVIVDAIQLKSQSTPYLNTITFMNIDNFGNYFQERFEHVNDIIHYNTRLIKLYKNNINFNWGLHIFDNLNKFIDICDNETKQRIGTLMDNLEMNKLKNTNNHELRKEIAVSHGGGTNTSGSKNDLSNYIVLFINFIMYHFPILIENNRLVSIFDSMHEKHGPLHGGSENLAQMGGSDYYEVNALKNYTGEEKESERLIYLISVKINEQTTKYFIKITLSIDQYRKEITNYHYLNEFTKKLVSHKKYAPNIMKIHSPWKNNEISSYVLQSDNKISLILDDTQYDMNIPPNMINRLNIFRQQAIRRSFNELYYMITEVDESYVPLVKTSNISQINKLRTYIQIAHDLHMLNKTLGFVHWDLHKENILFKLKPDNVLCPKYFDFDLSDLCLVSDEHNMIELNNRYFIATQNYKMCTSDNLSIITDANILVTNQNIQYRIKTGYLFDLIRLHTSFVYNIDEQCLVGIGNNVKQFIIGWTNEIKFNDAIKDYFNTAPEYVITWCNNENTYNECIGEFTSAYNFCFEYEYCQTILMCGYAFMFSQKYNHKNKSLFFHEIFNQVNGLDLKPENKKYMTDELTILQHILTNKQYTAEDNQNKFSTLYDSAVRKCNVSPSVAEYQFFIYHNVKKQLELKQKQHSVKKKTSYGYTKKDYLALV